MPLDGQRQIAWAPHPGPQHALIKCPADEIFYGGARGGGKTDGMLGKYALKASRYGKDAIGVFFRRSREDLREAIARSHQIYGPLGADWHEQKKEWMFPNGARLKFQYLDRDADANNYQGHNYTDLFFEELTNWPDPTPINKLRATLRSAVGVPCQFHATGNPGGPGHQWVKARYIDPAPSGWEFIHENFENPFTGETIRLSRVFIPSKLTDNPALVGDATYVGKLYQSGSEELVKAWLLGDWNVIEGAYFDCWDSAKHVIPPFEVPEHWLKFGAFDWGSARPSSYGLYAVSDGTPTPDGRFYPPGALIKVREVYTAKEPNVGTKETAEVVADRILGIEAGHHVRYRVADPAIFSADGGPSIAERMIRHGVTFRRADNKRVARDGAMGGWDQMRARLVGEDGRPMLYFFDTCRDSIRTIPALQHDENRPEDVDTESEDHAADETRYACMSRPYTRTMPIDEEPRWKPTINEMIQAKRRMRMAEED